MARTALGRAGAPGLIVMSGDRTALRTRRRGRPHATDRDTVARTALSLARSWGIEGVTVKRVADELGLAPMTVYRVTAGRAELHSLMVETLMANVAFTPQPGVVWTDQLCEALHGLYAGLRRNPAIIELMVAQQPVFGPRLDRMREGLLAVVGDAFGSRREAIDTINLLTSCVVGIAAAEVSRSRRSAELADHLQSAGGDAHLWLEPLPDDRIDRAIRRLVALLPDRVDA